MHKQFGKLLILLFAIVFITVGCSNSEEPVEEDPPEEDVNNEKENNTNNSNNNDDNNENNETNENIVNNNQNNQDNNSNNENEDPSNDNDEPMNEDEEPSDTVELPEDIEIDERVQHPNGVIFTLEKISFSEDNITVDFHAHNGHGNYVYFADKPGVTLEDDTGFDYPYMPKSYADDWLELDSGDKMTASLSFMGKIDDNAKSLTLKFNEDGSPDDEDERKPPFIFEDIDLGR